MSENLNSGNPSGVSFDGYRAAFWRQLQNCRIVGAGPITQAAGFSFV
jgi:hypothetical protein